MQSVRVTAAGAVVVASLSFLTAPAGACDDRYIKKCEREAAARAVQADAAPAVERKSAKRTRAIGSRRARFVKRTRAPRFAHKRERETTPGAQRMTALVPESVLARRFRGFIDPRPLADNAFEVLRKPHIVAVDFDAAAIVPPATTADAAVAANSEPAAIAPSTGAMPKQDRMATRSVAIELAAAESKPIMLAGMTPKITVAPPIEASAAQTIVSAAPPDLSDQQPSRFSIHQLVLALCGALGAASALRFIVGA